jgi:hypothetical protein
MTQSTRFSGASAAVAALALTMATCSPAAVAPAWAAEGPFSNFSGSWAGSGTVTVKNGTRERLRCRASYQISAGGLALAQNLTCASDSYRFNVVSSVVAQGTALSGTWSETSRGAQGRISGRIEPREILANVAGMGFSAGIAISSRGAKQVVNIRPSGTDITEVAVSMSRV